MANYNLLSAIQPPQVVGQLPVMPNQADQTASGIMQGLAQGQAMQAQAQQMRASQQQMQQSAQLFPGQMQAQQQGLVAGDIANKSAKIDLSNKEAIQAHAEALRDAAAKGEGAYMQAMTPDEQLDYLGKKAKLQSSISEVAKNYSEVDKNKGAGRKANSEADKLDLDNAGTITHQAAQVLYHVSGYQDPQKQEAAYQELLKTLPSATQKILPDHYDANTAAILMAQDKQNLADALDQKAKTTKASTAPSDTEKTTEYLTTLQSAVDNAKTPEEKAQAQQKLDIGMREAKATPGVWEKIKNLIPSPSTKTPATSTIPDGRIAVKDSKGNLGHIPASQLKDAMKAGYTPVTNQ